MPVITRSVTRSLASVPSPNVPVSATALCFPVPVARGCLPERPFVPALTRRFLPREHHGDAMCFAKLALKGDLPALKKLRAEGCPWDEQACASAAYGGHLGVLKWLRAEGCPWFMHRVLVNATLNAASTGQYSTVIWIRAHSKFTSHDEHAN